jgi:alpha-L-fucosidase
MTLESDVEFDQRMAWFNDAQFGLFIHYGVYSTLEGEWEGKEASGYAEWIQARAKILPEDYIPLAANFKPDQLDADLWVRTAKEAGMKYMVITTKHHEGFCLWDSEHTEYDLGEATEFGRDILAELKAACDKYGLKFGTYYSIIDWHHPTQRSDSAGFHPPMRDKAEYVRYMKAQLKELIVRYDTDILWFDGDWAKWWTMEDGLDLYHYLRELKPDLIINNRVAKRGRFKKDYGTPENNTPGLALDHYWEACWTVNHSWGFKKGDTNWKSTKELIQKQIEINSKGGNLLLNVGPKADGSWPEATIVQLKKMGAWNRRYADAVYGSDFVAIQPPTWGVLTQAKGATLDAGALFAYVFDWPANGELELRGVAFSDVEVTTYDGTELPTTVSKDGVHVDLSSISPDQYATVLRFNYQGGMLASKDGGLELQGDELFLQASEAQLSGTVIQLQGELEIGHWTNPQYQASWEFDMPAPGKYNISLLYSCDSRYSGSDVKLTVGGQELSVKVVPTGSGWDTYQLLAMGQVELNQVGRTTCIVGFGEKHAKALLNLKTIILAPVDH